MPLYDLASDVRFSFKQIQYLLENRKSELRKIRDLHQEFEKNRDPFLLPRLNLLREEFLNNAKSAAGLELISEAGLILLFLEMPFLLSNLEVSDEAKQSA